MPLYSTNCSQGCIDTISFRCVLNALQSSSYLQKFQQKLHIHSFYPKTLNLSLFSLYKQRFLSHGSTFKIIIFVHETWQKLHRLFFFPQRGRNWAYYRLAVSEIWADFQTYHIWEWHLAIGKNSRYWTWEIRPPQNSGQFMTVPWVSLIPRFHCISSLSTPIGSKLCLYCRSTGNGYLISIITNFNRVLSFIVLCKFWKCYSRQFWR